MALSRGFAVSCKTLLQLLALSNPPGPHCSSSNLPALFVLLSLCSVPLFLALALLLLVSLQL